MSIEYDELNSLVQSGKPQTSALAEADVDLRDRPEAVGKRQNELLDELPGQSIRTPSRIGSTGDIRQEPESGARII